MAIRQLDPKEYYQVLLKSNITKSEANDVMLRVFGIEYKDQYGLFQFF